MARMRSGRCKPCGLLYRWLSGGRRRLKRAYCSRCGEKLSRTSKRLDVLRVTVSQQAPNFRG